MAEAQTQQIEAAQETADIAPVEEQTEAQQTGPEAEHAEPERAEEHEDTLKGLGELELDSEAQAQALIKMGLAGDGEYEPPADTGAEAEPKPESTAEFYTAEELGNTPLDAIDMKRLPEGAREYLPIVKRNMDAARQAIAHLQQQNAMLMQQLQANTTAQAPAPANPDFKALAAQAAKIAKERLGLGEDDDLDMTYEPEHAAAFHMAMREVADGMRQSEAAPANVVDMGAAREWDAYVSQLGAQPDAAARVKWITEKLTQAGKNPNMLGEYIRQTGDYAGARRVIDAWNRMYDTEQARMSQAVKNQARPVQKPPVLEGASGTDAGGRRSMNLRAFGAMEENPEAQAQALLKLGLV
jgi:hypothetical protein